MFIFDFKYEYLCLMQEKNHMMINVYYNSFNNEY